MAANTKKAAMGRSNLLTIALIITLVSYAGDSNKF